MHASLNLFKSLFIVIMAFYLSSCTTVNQAAVPTEQEINAEAEKAYVDVKAKSKSSNRRDWNEMVQRVAQRIAVASGENFKWEAILIDNPEPNAWCMPGGKIAVYTGIMPILKTEGALAAVLGHEVAHATRRHGQKGYARAIQEQQTGLIVGVAAVVAGEVMCKTENCKKWAAIGGAAGALAVTFFNRKFSREDESEADHYGQNYMAKAGYDPSEAIQLWNRMGASKSGVGMPEWMSTHPSDSNRKEQLSKWLPQAQIDYNQSPRKYGTGDVITN